MIADERYVSLTTRKRDGSTVSSPVWITALPDGRVGFTTGGASGKAKRIRNFPEVTLQACDSRGRVRPGAPVVAGQAAVVDGAEFAAVRDAVKAKYGVMFTLMAVAGNVMAKLGRAGGPDAAVVVELDAADG